MLSKHIDMADKLEAIENEKKLRNQGSTFSQFAEADAATSLGRYSSISNPTVVGSEPSPATQYTAGADWTRDPVPNEMPLGYAINELVGDSPIPVSKGRTFRRT